MNIDFRNWTVDGWVDGCMVIMLTTLTAVVVGGILLGIWALLFASPTVCQ